MVKAAQSGKAPSAKKIMAKKAGVSKSSVTKKASRQKGKSTENFPLIFGRISVPVTNPQKIYFKKEGISKNDVIDYYQEVSDHLLPYLKNRPQSLNRHPNGIDATGFYQKDAGENVPEWIKTFGIYAESSDRMVDYIICNNKATLAYLNNLGCIELNPWHSVISKPDNPDYLIIDLDPSEKNSFDDVIEAALCVKEVFDSGGAKSFIKTSGGTGLHVYVPMGKKYGYEAVKELALLVCRIVEEQLPRITTLERSLKKRKKNQIYLDYLQNNKAQTIASVYCLRPKKGAPVSMPLRWKEVKKGLSPLDFNIFNAQQRIRKMGDIFRDVLGPGIALTDCMEALGEKYGA